MSEDAIRWTRSLRGVAGVPKAILFLLASDADHNGDARPSVAQLSAESGFSPRTVGNALTALEEHRLIVAVDRTRGRPTRWHLDLSRAEPETSAPGAGQHQMRTPEPRQEMQTTSACGAELSPNLGRRCRPPRQEVQRFSTIPLPALLPTPLVPPSPSALPLPPYNPPTHQPTPSPRAKPAPVDVVLPAWLPPDAWADWCAYRRGKRWTQLAAELSLRKLAAFRDAGDDPRAVIEQSIANGWTGLFALKGAARGPPGKPDRSTTIREIMAELDLAPPPPRRR